MGAEPPRTTARLVLIGRSPQHKNGFFTLRVSVAGRRMANSLDDEAALLEYLEGRHVARCGGSDQRAVGDFPQ